MIFLLYAFAESNDLEALKARDVLDGTKASPRDQSNSTVLDDRRVLHNSDSLVQKEPSLHTGVYERLHDSSNLLDSHDVIEDSMFDPIQADGDCETGAKDCWSPPDSTVDEEYVVLAPEGTCTDDENETNGIGDNVCEPRTETRVVDKHWGSDPHILRMRDQLRETGSGISNRRKARPLEESGTSDSSENRRPPIFLLPGLASTRLMAWKFKRCPQNALLSDIKVQDYVWLNLNLIFQMSTIDNSCMVECMSLGWNQSDTDQLENGCKLRPDEGLDAISSLSPAGVGSELLVGGTNTVYAWLIQWLADNLGYDVTNVIGLPYDWRLSPDKMQQRDGFLTLTRRRMEAAVQTNGKPGIVIAHSMGNLIFRYFLEWLRAELRDEAYERFKKQAARRAKAMKHASYSQDLEDFWPGWMQGVISHYDGTWTQDASNDEPMESSDKHAHLLVMAQVEGDSNWYEWIEKHIWTYVGLSAPLLGAVNPVRAVISGENMGLPFTDATARILELSFGSTNTCSPVSSKSGFCDDWDQDDWAEEPNEEDNLRRRRLSDSRLACLDDIAQDIELSHRIDSADDPWENFPSLKNLLMKRSDWDTDFPMLQIVTESCDSLKDKATCAVNKTVEINPKDVERGNHFQVFRKIWNEKDDPLQLKWEQLKESFWDTKVDNMLNRTWERPLIKHVIMAYGVDIPTEVGYIYKRRDDKKTAKQEHDGIPQLGSTYWETAGGVIELEDFDSDGQNFVDILLMKKRKPKRVRYIDGHHGHSGDGSVPYLSLSWAHTWLLHQMRAARHSSTSSSKGNPLNSIKISHRPKGATEWKEGPVLHRVAGDHLDASKDTGTSHPHGTRYKPEMRRYDSTGTSRTTGIEYTTTVIEAIGVEHKETTRYVNCLGLFVMSMILSLGGELRQEL